MVGEVVADSVVVTHLADSPAVALVRDSWEENPISRAQALVISHFTMAASITASLLMTVSSDTTTASSPISRSSGLASLTGTQTTMARIPTTTQTMTANRVTMTNIWTSRPHRRNRNSPDAPTTPPRLREWVASAVLGRWDQVMTVVVTARPAQKGENWTSYASRQPEQKPIPLSSLPKIRTHRAVLLPT